MNIHKLDNEGYCTDCKSDHHCINCPYMDNLEHYHDWLLDIIEKTENLGNNNKGKNEIVQRICGCSNPIIGNYPMCRECYWKSRI